MDQQVSGSSSPAWDEGAWGWFCGVKGSSAPEGSQRGLIPPEWAPGQGRAGEKFHTGECRHGQEQSHKVAPGMAEHGPNAGWGVH